ncbi:MAG: hypothetical protein HY841_12930 [Bacteroidetes bacterium]|nr:hypothetical protein [Bacteroidota bacterium]
MKKQLLLFLSFFIFISSQAQIKKRYNRPFFGLNIGGTYEQSDVKDIAHAGWGFTFGKYYMQNETNLFDVGWRLRYLNGTTSGQDGFRNNDLKNNSALNGIQDSAADYFHHGGYVYNNYQMKFNEGAFEVMLGLNRLREKTRVVVYGFGGMGISGWQTKTNQLNPKGKRYAYDSLGTSPSRSAIEAMLDDSYETNADGNSKMKVHFVPSAGIGLGWQTKRGHYIGLEHRITFTMNDYTDGVTQSGGGFFGGNNDMYDYTGFFVRWMIGGGSTTYHATDPTGYSNNPPPPPPPPTYTYTTVNPPPPPPPPPGNKKPAIVINYPNINPYTTNNSMMTVTASVFNVGSRNDISVKVNGFPSQNFAYDMMTKVLTLTTTLNPGNNAFYLSAVNPYGNDWKNVNVIYEQGGNPPQMQKPLITITNPLQNPFSTNQSSVTVMGTVMNVSSRNDITAYVNGTPNGAFTYDANTKILALTTKLDLGSNSIKFNATNPFGSDSKSQTIIYQAAPPPPPPSSKPIVIISSPSPSPYHTNVASQIVNATVQNVNSQNEITVVVNGTPAPFSYDANTKNLMVANNNLNIGNNIFTITASNQNGSDSKSVTVVYANKQAQEKPVVTITSPNPNPYNTKSNSVSVNATVVYVFSKQEISVQVNNQPFTNFNYDISSKTLSLTSNLNEGNNSFVITATNQHGSDSKSLAVIYTKKEIMLKPVVTINTPSSNSFKTEKNNVDVTATVLTINSKNDITVKVNNSSFLNFIYSTDSKILTFNSSLNPGSNTIIISASNAAGNDSKSVTVNYNKPVELPKPIVTITYPASNPFTSNSPNLTITATVMNVSSKNDITITTMGNAQITNFNYDLNTKLLSFSPTLMPSTLFTIKATTPQGSDSKSITIKYVKQTGIVEMDPIKGEGIKNKLKPVVTITTPASNPAQVSNSTVQFTATVLNINSQNDIKITLNGSPFKNFVYSAESKTVSFTATMPLGANNVIVITGTNSYGSDSKSITVNVT